MKNNLNIAEMIATVKEEISRAQEQVSKGNAEGLFLLDEMELEIKFVVTKDEQAGAKLKVVFAEGGGNVTYKNEEVQTIKLRFKAAKQKEKAPNLKGIKIGGGGMMKTNPG